MVEHIHGMDEVGVRFSLGPHKITFLMSSIINVYFIDIGRIGRRSWHLFSKIGSESWSGVFVSDGEQKTGDRKRIRVSP